MLNNEPLIYSAMLVRATGFLIIFLIRHFICRPANKILRKYTSREGEKGEKRGHFSRDFSNANKCFSSFQNKSHIHNKSILKMSWLSSYNKYMMNI